MNKINKGFTFVELMVVIAIGSILFAVASVTFRDVNISSRDARRKSDMEAIRQALELCRSYSGLYPDVGGVVGGSPITCGTPAQTFMTKVPVDPKDDRTNYVYTPDAGRTTYTLKSTQMEKTYPGECDALVLGKCTIQVTQP